jgi:dipeptidase E
MQWCKNIIAYFVNGHSEKILFIPYAAVGLSYLEYTRKVNDALKEHSLEVQNLDDFDDKVQALSSASAIFVGGGNTFHLLKSLQDMQLISTIQQVVSVGTPYIGWSAGSNIASPTICTTNDMPIVQPASFQALNLISLQINPHYTEDTLANHGGESRKQRLQEYLIANPNQEVMCLPEASYIEVNGTEIVYKGTSNSKLLTRDGETIIYNEGKLLS